MGQEADLRNALPKPERDLVVTALQALHRERVTAWHAAETVAHLRNMPAPDQFMFGIDEATQMLRRFGAGPH